MLESINQVLSQTTSEEWSEGKAWYPRAFSFCQELGKKFDKDVKQVAGLLSAFSPMKEWELNKRMTEEYLVDGTCKTFGAQGRKAFVICGLPKDEVNDSLIETILKGDKTISFYYNIAYPHIETRVTIDTHMLKGLTHWEHITPKRFFRIDSNIRSKAKELKLLPHELQAILWLTIRRTKWNKQK